MLRCGDILVTIQSNFHMDRGSLMTVAKEHKKWVKDHKRWLADHKKWRGDHRKIIKSLNKLEKLVRRHEDEMKVFGKKVILNQKLMAKSHHSNSTHRKLKNAHLKQASHHKLHTKANKDIIQITKAIEKAIKHFS